MGQECERCGARFEIEERDLHFYERVSPILGDTTVGDADLGDAALGDTALGNTVHRIPPPRCCPECRMTRRLLWRNEYRYYRRSCDLCSKSIISVFHADQPFPVYCHSCWWSDQWQAATYARDFDFSRTFAEQFAELYRQVPQKAMIIESSSENCEYCQDIGYAKDCYLVTGSWKLRDCYFSSNCNRSSDLVDCDSVNVDCELAYECTDSQRLYRCTFLSLSSGCSDCHYGIDLKGCSDCIGCYGLRQQRHCIFNVRYSESEYRSKLAEMRFSSFAFREELGRQFDLFTAKFPRRAAHLVSCEDCVGDKLFQCRDVHGFDTFHAEHCRWFYKGDGPKNCYDVHQSGGPEWCYESLTPDDSYMTCFSTWCFKSNRFVYYSDSCHQSENLFGCIGMKAANHAVFNRPYSAAEYKRLVSRIIRHMEVTGDWGEFFPTRFSPFAYNETLAHDLAPLTQAEASAAGYRWREEEPRPGASTNQILPDDIAAVTDSFTSTPLGCSDCGKHYRMFPRELAFYQKMEVPAPRRCVECRRKRRWARRTPYRLWERACDACQALVRTSFSPDRPERVFCDFCYTGFLNRPDEDEV